MLVVSSVAGVFHSIILSFMLLIIMGFYVLKYAMLLSNPGRFQQAKTQQPIGIVSPVICIEYTTALGSMNNLCVSLEGPSRWLMPSPVAIWLNAFTKSLKRLHSLTAKCCCIDVNCVQLTLSGDVCLEAF